ncbi:2768_t:CDS:2 [Acaulospora morrowiae]|uniref:2768_t:CDS:1 n=1 Tax=Acaulospora morrowiae TaxID=94023 RepID=A0A9N9D1Q3_9GLOM|nr:2768_t:CDS:2 [Acaulospora morrowiae]
MACELFDTGIHVFSSSSNQHVSKGGDMSEVTAEIKSCSFSLLSLHFSTRASSLSRSAGPTAERKMTQHVNFLRFNSSGGE